MTNMACPCDCRHLGANGDIARREAARLRSALDDAASRSFSSGSWIELHAVVVRGRHPLAHELPLLMSALRIGIVPVTVEQAMIGADAYRRYGIGSGDRARLNFGDCFAYALAIETTRPLLFKGDDFGRTDVTVAKY